MWPRSMILKMNVGYHYSKTAASKVEVGHTALITGVGLIIRFHILDLNSSVEKDDSTWKVEVDQDHMRWTGIGDRKKENTILMFSKKT